MVKISTVAKALPKYTKTTAEILPFIEGWLSGQKERFRKKALMIFQNAGVDRRYSILSPEEMFQTHGFEARNNLYIERATSLAKDCLVNALEKARWKATDIDYVITVSCTGFMIPSVDAHLINQLEMRQDVVRLPVTEMGCAAGVSGIIYAKNFLQANPGKRAAVIAVESPMATFQQGDFSMVNIVSAAIFGDGAACALLSSHEEDEGPVILAEEMYHFYDALHMMGFALKDTGLHMMLDRSVPDTIAKHFPKIIHPFLAKANTKIEDINHMVFHPGGRKIVHMVETLFGEMGKNIDDTKEVLRIYGNMSSATVLYVLERFLERDIPSGDKGLMLSFGPGFSAQRVLLEW